MFSFTVQGCVRFADGSLDTRSINVQAWNPNGAKAKAKAALRRLTGDPFLDWYGFPIAFRTGHPAE